MSEYKNAEINPRVLYLIQCESKILSNETKYIYGREYNRICMLDIYFSNMLNSLDIITIFKK